MASVDPKAKAAETKKRFLDVWPQLEKELVDLMKQHNMPDDATEWFRRVCLSLSPIMISLTNCVK